MRRIAVLIVVICTAAAAARSSIATAHFIVRGTVGPGATIALEDGIGSPYTTGRPGMYIFKVTDRSSQDGFHLVGPHVSVVMTGVHYVGARTVGITLGPGTYHYLSDAHPRSVRGTFVLKR